MLVQSTIGELRILPALPDDWDQGSVKGIRARGGLEISMDWKNNKPTNLTINSKTDTTINLKLGDKQKVVSLKQGDNSIIFW